MFKLSDCNQHKETQTELSAFFCMRAKTVARAIPQLVTVVLFVALCPQTRALGEDKPAVRLKGVSVKAVNWNNRTVQTELSIAVENPGPAFKLSDLSYRLKLNNRHAAEGKYEKEIEVPSRSSATFDLPCEVDLSAVPGVAWAVAAGGFDVHYELETEFTVPLFLTLAPRLKTSIEGDLSLTGTISRWTARIKERIAGK